MPPDNQLKSQVSQSLRSSILTSNFDFQVRELDFHTQTVYHEIRRERGIQETKMTYEERTVFVTKLVYWLQSRCEGKDDFSKKAAQFFQKNDRRTWGERLRYTDCITRGND
jgi:hypothetical protein